MTNSTELHRAWRPDRSIRVHKRNWLQIVLLSILLTVMTSCGSTATSSDTGEEPITYPEQNTQPSPDTGEEPITYPEQNTQPSPDTGEATQKSSETSKPTNWTGAYFFDNDGGKEAEMMLGNELELEIKGEGLSELGIFSKSMGTPHAILKVKAEQEATECRIIHAEYIKGNGWENLEVGAELFSLSMENGKLITTWGAWKPLYGNLPDRGNYFQKQ